MGTAAMTLYDDSQPFVGALGLFRRYRPAEQQDYVAGGSDLPTSETLNQTAALHSPCDAAENVEQWLLLRNDERQLLRLPEARRDGMSYRESLIDVIEASLPLSRKKHFIVSGHARAHHQAPIQWEDTGSVVWIVIQFIVIDLYGRESEQILDDHDGCEWVAPADLQIDKPTANLKVCPRQRHLLERADVFGQTARRR